MLNTRGKRKQNRNTESTVTSDSPLAVTHTFLPSYHTYPALACDSCCCVILEACLPPFFLQRRPPSFSVHFQTTHGLCTQWNRLNMSRCAAENHRNQRHFFIAISVDNSHFFLMMPLVSSGTRYTYRRQQCYSTKGKFIFAIQKAHFPQSTFTKIASPCAVVRMHKPTMGFRRGKTLCFVAYRQFQLVGKPCYEIS